MIFSVIAPIASATQAEGDVKLWQLIRSEDGIIIHQLTHESGLIELRAQTITQTTFSGFYYLLEDTNNIHAWLSHAEKVTILKTISNTENIVLTQFQAPWPASNRDMVIYSRYSQPEKGVLALEIKDRSDYIDQQEGYIRIREVRADWYLQKLKDGRTYIAYSVYANPGGLLPDWLANQVAETNVFNTFQKLKMRLPLYQEKTHPFIKE